MLKRESTYGRSLRPGSAGPLCSALLACFALFACAVVPELQAQKTARNDKTARRLVKRVEPVYPRDLQRLSIGGIVRLDVQISARGSVEKVAIVGGNPILAESAVKAVRQWQYEPAAASSSLLLSVEFTPQR